LSVQGGFRWLERLLRPQRSPRREEVQLAGAEPAGSDFQRAAFAEWRELRRLATQFENVKAQTRGITLLRANLSPAQRAQFDKDGYFEVIGGKTGRRYRIRSGTMMNIERLGAGRRVVHGLCFAPEGNLVSGDVMLAQKLALELFEADALRVANKFCAS
jgi:hypothetical protein